MTYEQLQDKIFDWTESHKAGILTVAIIIGAICFLLEANNVIQ